MGGSARLLLTFAEPLVGSLLPPVRSPVRLVSSAVSELEANSIPTLSRENTYVRVYRFPLFCQTHWPPACWPPTPSRRSALAPLSSSRSRTPRPTWTRWDVACARRVAEGSREGRLSRRYIQRSGAMCTDRSSGSTRTGGPLVDCLPQRSVHVRQVLRFSRCQRPPNRIWPHPRTRSFTQIGLDSIQLRRFAQER